MSDLIPLFAIAYQPWTTRPHRYYMVGNTETQEWMPLVFGFWWLIRTTKAEGAKP